MSDYRNSMNDWCNDCCHGPKPSKICRDCDKPDVTEKDGATLIGRPSNFKFSIVTEATMKKPYADYLKWALKETKR